MILLAFSSSCFSQDFVKNGRACITEICLGDGIDELRKINWLPASRYTPSDLEKLHLNNFFPEKPSESLSQYLIAKSFDSRALNDLSKITFFCKEDSPTLSGRYKTANSSTEVFISLQPKSNTESNLSWQVVSMRRFLTSSSSFSEEDELAFKKQVSERYKDFMPKELTAAFGRNGLDYVSYTTSSSSLSFDLLSKDLYKKLKQPAQCNKNITLD
jgi:hypothetical protein